MASLCDICNRPLSDPDSVMRGIGPICYGKHVVAFSENAERDYVAFPMSKGVLLDNSTGDQRTNVPHLVTHHSPDGFSWGYLGSGPADLALNILEYYLTDMGYEGRRTKCFEGDCWELAWKLHHPFKEEFLSTPKGPDMDSCCSIPAAIIKKWILNKAFDHGKTTQDKKGNREKSPSLV